MPQSDAAYLAEDARDRRDALAAATLLATSGPHRVPWHRGEPYGDDWLKLAADAYRWLRARPSLRVAALRIIPGTPTKEGTPVTTSINLQDDQEVNFTLGGTDDKGAAVPAPSDTWDWTLNDPDQSGAALTVSADTTNATVACGQPTANLSLSVAGASTGLTGAEAIVVNAGAAVNVALVAGTPSQETPPAT